MKRSSSRTCGASGLGRADGEQLAGIVPLVERLGGGDALVALQAHERGVDRRGQRLRRLRLPDAGLALQQHRLAQSDGAEQGGRQAEVGEVVDAVEGGAQLGNAVDEVGPPSRARVPIRLGGERPQAAGPAEPVPPALVVEVQ